MNSGKVPVNVLKRSVLRQLKNKRTEIADSAGLGADCAVFAPFSKGQMVTCVQEGVVELQCENDLAEAEREDLSVMPMRRIFQKCANNLAAAGAEPVAAELVIFLPETVEEPELKALMEEAEKAATDQSKLCGKTADCYGNGIRYPERSRSDAGIRREKAGGSGYHYYQVDRSGGYCGSGGPEPGEAPCEIPSVSGRRSSGI